MHTWDHDDVIKWKHFPRYWPFARRIPRSPVTELPAQRPVTRSFDVLFDPCLNKRLGKQSWDWWFETPSRPLWRHCNAQVSIGSCNGLVLSGNKSLLEPMLTQIYVTRWKRDIFAISNFVRFGLKVSDMCSMMPTVVILFIHVFIHTLINWFIYLFHVMINECSTIRNVTVSKLIATLYVFMANVQTSMLMK